MERAQLVSEIFDLIKGLLSDYDGGEDPSLTFAQIGIDSLTTVDLVVAAESTFDIEIPDEALPKLATVGDLADYVLENTSDVALA
ncbi:acyl carrier protein [Actinoplanes sp. HUAS TT8]|uniref:acyl carrier protein n=1 Tax=Actinoplanes sp. HUAS TT8 TaxID=3447453 RepID=UPI003F523785